MNSLVIVAIPAEDDLVWKISSEKVPHLTLLYLGEADASGTDRMAEFVEHALNIHGYGPFYLEVDHRGELGDDKADVLFFEGGWDSKWIKQLRSQLLKQNDIRTAYESVEQFPEWVPHLTLGYPDAPAKPVPDDRKIYSVEFDRIAVWNGNYDGPGFRLKWDRSELTETHGSVYEGPLAAMSSVNQARAALGLPVGEDVLNHYGVKGMRWGQRKSTPSVVEKPKNALTGKQVASVIAFGPLALASRNIRDGLATNQINNAQYQKDKRWEKDFKKARGFGFDDQKFTKDYNEKFKDSDFSKEDWDNPSPKYKEYVDGYFNEMSTAYAQQYSAHFGSSPSGKYEAQHQPGTDLVKLRKKDVAQHADEMVLTFRVTRDDKGLISKVEVVEDSLTHSNADVVDLGARFVLEHYGVKGMRWGVRRDRTPTAVAPTATSKVPAGARRKTKIKTEGGENHPASEDAIKVAQARTKLAKSGAAALSNKELREVADRMRLEEQVTQMTRSSGSKFVRRVLSNQGNQAANQAVRNQIDERLFKKNK